MLAMCDTVLWNKGGLPKTKDYGSFFIFHTDTLELWVKDPFVSYRPSCHRAAVSLRERLNHRSRRALVMSHHLLTHHIRTVVVMPLHQHASLVAQIYLCRTPHNHRPSTTANCSSY
jgi:hypothetical protein